MFSIATTNVERIIKFPLRTLKRFPKQSTRHTIKQINQREKDGKDPLVGTRILEAALKSLRHDHQRETGQESRADPCKKLPNPLSNHREESATARNECREGGNHFF